MKKLFLAAWICLVACVCAHATPVMRCSELGQMPPGYVFSAQDIQTLEEKLGKEPREIQPIFRAVLYFCGFGYPKDTAKALQILQSAAGGGNVDAILIEFALVAGMIDGTPNMAKGVEVLRKYAQAGQPEIQMALGLLYARGRDIPRDTAEAEKWFLKAASQGNADAQDELGATYFARENYQGALPWLRLATLQGKARAHFLLQEIDKTAEASGLPAPLADVKSIELEEVRYYSDQKVADKERLLRAAVQDGKPESKLALATFLEATAWGQPRLEGALGASQATEGSQAVAQVLARRLRQRNTEAVAWLKKAAEQGSVEASYKLGTAYWYGALGLSDEQVGLRMIRNAAAQGHPDAVYWLARAYQQGTGLRISFVAAYALYFRYEALQANGTLALSAYVPPSDVTLNAQDLQQAKQLAQALAQPGQFLSALDAVVGPGGGL